MSAPKNGTKFEETNLVLGILSLKEKLLRTRLHKDPALVNKVPGLAEQGGSTLWQVCSFGFRKGPSCIKKKLIATLTNF